MDPCHMCTEHEQTHTLEWAYGFYAYANRTLEHSRGGNGNRTMVADAVCAPALPECRQDSLNMALGNMERRR